jgi:hypothetical protein
MREAWDTCRFCEFDRLCAVDRGAAWERVEDDPATGPFHALAFDDEPVDEDGDGEEGEG